MTLPTIEMQTHNFQVTLLSNASAALYPSNCPAHFRTQLASPLNLEGDWEVAPIDIQFINLIKTFNTKCKLAFLISAPANSEIKETLGLDAPFNELVGELKEKVLRDTSLVTKHVRDLTPQYFPGPISFARYLEGLFREAFNGREGFTTVLDAATNKLIMRPSGSTSVYVVSDKSDLFLALGMEPKGLTNRNGEVWYLEINNATSVLSPPKLPTITAVMLYTDIIRFQYVGDTLAPLLGVFPVQVDYGESLYWAFPDPQFTPLNKLNINSIEILLSSDTGTHIPLDVGRVVLRLQFRRSV